MKITRTWIVPIVRLALIALIAVAVEAAILGLVCATVVGALAGLVPALGAGRGGAGQGDRCHPLLGPPRAAPLLAGNHKGVGRGITRIG
ncbi:hypothetical protein [Cryobacterium psychrophilum]|uniref:Uncharacterized protein n=1 Tax=Cryobacterium psychrophilum TaxID=41988 RepID=A0A4Y8KQX1_9MICO|nr:hypothetical protein [Cryobacterium psychrophilum]TDW29022.1 hypothetical protein EDD25_0698 [Cryobacterium psychrophilum]TFD79760.1 hypothetical protein E3T53_07035 [Cryobacterium psychrophilum]